MGDVIALFGELVRRCQVFERQRNLEARFGAGECQERVGKFQRAERFRRHDLQRARVLVAIADEALFALDLAEDPFAEFQIWPRLLGRHDIAGRALQQREAEMALKLHDTARDQRARDAELPRGDGEVAGMHHAHEAFHGLQAVHVKRPGAKPLSTILQQSCV